MNGSTISHDLRALYRASKVLDQVVENSKQLLDYEPGASCINAAGVQYGILRAKIVSLLSQEYGEEADKVFTQLPNDPTMFDVFHASSTAAAFITGLMQQDIFEGQVVIGKAAMAKAVKDSQELMVEITTGKLAAEELSVPTGTYL